MGFLLFFGGLIILGLALLFIGLVVVFIGTVIFYTVRGINDTFRTKARRRRPETLEFTDYPGPIRHQ